MIVQRDKVIEAFERARALEPRAGDDVAIAAAAQALCLPAEAVAEVVRERVEVES